MSKVHNHIIVIIGVCFICGIIIFGVIKYFTSQEIQDIQKNALDFIFYVIPATIATSFAISGILNLAESKEKKQLLSDNNLLLKERNTLLKERNTLHETSITKLAKIEEEMTINESNSKKIVGYFEAQKQKDKDHDKQHDKINVELKKINTWINLHSEEHEN